MKIKTEHIGKVIVKGSQRIELRADMTEKEILYVKNMISPYFVEEEIIEIEVIVPEEAIQEENKPSRKRKKKQDD